MQEKSIHSIRLSDPSINKIDKYELGLQAALAIAQLHKQNRLHGDVRSENLCSIGRIIPPL